MFLGSIVAATLLLVVMAFFARRLDESRADDLKRIRILVGIEYAFFLAGVACFAWRMLEAWLEANPA